MTRSIKVFAILTLPLLVADLGPLRALENYFINSSRSDFGDSVEETESTDCAIPVIVPVIPSTNWSRVISAVTTLPQVSEAGSPFSAKAKSRASVVPSHSEVADYSVPEFQFPAPLVLSMSCADAASVVELAALAPSGRTPGGFHDGRVISAAFGYANSTRPTVELIGAQSETIVQNDDRPPLTIPDPQVEWGSIEFSVADNAPTGTCDRRRKWRFGRNGPAQ